MGRSESGEEWRGVRREWGGVEREWGGVEENGENGEEWSGGGEWEEWRRRMGDENGEELWGKMNTDLSQFLPPYLLWLEQEAG